MSAFALPQATVAIGIVLAPFTGGVSIGAVARPIHLHATRKHCCEMGTGCHFGMTAAPVVLCATQCWTHSEATGCNTYECKERESFRPAGHAQATGCLLGGGSLAAGAGATAVAVELISNDIASRLTAYDEASAIVSD